MALWIFDLGFVLTWLQKGKIVECPHCRKTLTLKPYVEGNVDSYDSCVLAKAQCCGNPVRVWQTRKLVCEKAETHLDRDDWGDIFSKQPNNQNEAIK